MKSFSLTHLQRIIMILTMAILGTTFSASAQKVVVESFEDNPMDITARQYARIDRNGVKCALVKVQVVAPGVTFQGNVMGEVEKHSSEYWVYLTAGTKMVKIAAETFVPLMYTFPQPLQSGTTYVLTLQVPQSTQQSDPYAADIAITMQYERFYDPSTDTPKWGYKSYGTVIIPAKYDYAWDFSEGLAPVKINGKWIFIDKSGNMIFPAKYDDARPFNEGLAAVKVNDKWGFIDKTATMVFPVKYDDLWSFREGLAMVKHNGKYGFIDKSGKEIIPVVYDEMGIFFDGLAPVRINGKSGFVDKTGNMTIPAKYENVWYFGEGLAAVKINGKWGFIDKNDTMVIPATFDDVHSEAFTNGTIQVQLNGRWFYIDRNGNEVK